MLNLIRSFKASCGSKTLRSRSTEVLTGLPNDHVVLVIRLVWEFADGVVETEEIPYIGRDLLWSELPGFLTYSSVTNGYRYRDYLECLANGRTRQVTLEELKRYGVPVGST